MIKVVLLDDHAIVRAALRELLQEDKEIAVIGEASSGQEGIRLVRALNPDVLLLDFMLPDLSGLEVTRDLVRLNPDIKILFLSSITQDLSVFRAFEAGARGYLPKHVQKDVLIRTIKTISTGQKMIPPSIAARFVLSNRNSYQERAFNTLSEREKEIMLCVVRGMSVDEISGKFGLSQKTVYSFRSRIFQKIGVNNDLDLTLLAMHYHIVKFETCDETETENS